MRNFLEEAHARYAHALNVAEKEAAHAEIVEHTGEFEKLEKKIHRYACVKCRKKYTAKSAHGFGFLSSWTRCDDTGRPVRAEAFGVRDMPKIGFCSDCADEIEKDIDSE